MAYALLMFFGAMEFTQRLFILGNEARDLPVSRWLLATVMPVGFGLLFLRFIQMGAAIWRGQASGLGVSEQEVHSFLPEKDSPEKDIES
jgi:C4-dicarboxylate transporter DctQ subunit